MTSSSAINTTSPSRLAGFPYGPLPPGEYQVIAERPDGSRVEERVRVYGEPEASIELEFP